MGSIFKMSRFFWLIAVIPVLVAAITITPNGKTLNLHLPSIQATESNYAKSRKLNITNLSVNERVRRLIPYMTFYYTNEAYRPIYPTGNSIETPKDLRYTNYKNVPQKEYVTFRNPPRNKVNRPVYNKVPAKYSNHDPFRLEQEFTQGHTFGRTQYKTPVQWSKPEVNLLNTDNKDQVQYYITDTDTSQKYKLVPYEQTPPVKVPQEPIKQLPEPIPIPVYSYPFKKTATKATFYNEIQHPEPVNPTTITENYYERNPKALLNTPKLETGFTPMLSDEPPAYEEDLKDVYDQSVKVETPLYIKTDSTRLAEILKSLQAVKTIPERITTDNIDSSIGQLIQKVRLPVLSTPKPFFKATEERKAVDKEYSSYRVKPSEDESENDVPSQYLDKDHLDYDTAGPPTSSQAYPLDEDDSEGGTPGAPGIDYPIYDTIPETAFDCKMQRYKGFFADPETRCQVWHYCELNGGQASFLCPNGTVFSQAALTCDWWFNVQCSSTTQLYVLNERLYKYILPHQPKFPEDYAGPLVDKYLTLKFKQMEEQLLKNKKNKSSSSEEPVPLDPVQATTGAGDESHAATSTMIPMEYLMAITHQPIARTHPVQEMSKDEGIQIQHVGTTGAIPPQYLLRHH